MSTKKKKRVRGGDVGAAAELEWAELACWRAYFLGVVVWVAS